MSGKDNNHLILNLVKQVKSIAYQLANIEAASGPLLREEFDYIGSQTFITPLPFSVIYSVEVRGVGALSESQYTVTQPNTITILDPLEAGDFIVVLYSEAGTSPISTYTQDQINTLLSFKEDLTNKQNSLDLDGLAEKYPTVDTINDMLLRYIKLFSRTGIANKSDQFELIVYDSNTVQIDPVDVAIFWDELFAPNATAGSAIKSFPMMLYPLTELVSATGGNVNITPLTADGLYVRFLGYDVDGNVVSSPDNFISNSAIVQLGVVTVVKTGPSVSFLSIVPNGRNVFSQPILANLNDLDRTTRLSATDITVNYNIGTPSLKSNPGIVTGIAINWRGLNNPNNTEPIDKFNYLGDSVVDFVSIDANFSEDTSPPTIHTLWTDLAEGVPINESFYNTTTGLRESLDVGKFSIKRVLIGVRGGFFLQDGEHATSAGFATIDIAKANIFTQFTNAIQPDGLVVEVARIIFQEGVTDFSDASKFFIYSTIGGSSSGGGIVTVPDASTLVKGILKLAGDLAGTADLPTVPGLLLKEDLTNKVQDIDLNQASTSLYASVKATFDWGLARFKLWAFGITFIGSTSYTIGLNDYKVKTIFQSSSSVAFTVPTNAFTSIPIGTTFDYTVEGAGAVTVSGAGVTFIGKKFVFTQGESFTLDKIATDLWVVNAGGGSSGNIDYEVITDTSHTLLDSNLGKQLIFTNSSAITVTIPTGLDSAFSCECLQQGTGQISFVGALGVTLRINSFEVPSTVERWSVVGIDNIPNVTEEYHLYGGLTSI